MLIQHVIDFVLLFTDISTSIFPSLTFLSILNLFQLEFSTAGFRRALFYQFLSRTAFDYLWKWRKQSYRRDNKSASNWPFFLYFFYLQMNTFRKLIWSLGLTYCSNSYSLLSSYVLCYTFWQFTGVRMEMLKAILSWLCSYCLKLAAKDRRIMVKKKNVLNFLCYLFDRDTLIFLFKTLCSRWKLTLNFDFELKTDFFGDGVIVNLDTSILPWYLVRFLYMYLCNYHANTLSWHVCKCWLWNCYVSYVIAAWIRK